MEDAIVMKYERGVRFDLFTNAIELVAKSNHAYRVKIDTTDLYVVFNYGGMHYFDSEREMTQLAWIAALVEWANDCERRPGKSFHVNVYLNNVESTIGLTAGSPIAVVLVSGATDEQVAMKHVQDHMAYDVHTGKQYTPTHKIEL